MTTISPEERRNDPSWNILNSSVENFNLRQRNQRIPSYEEFITPRKAATPARLRNKQDEPFRIRKPSYEPKTHAVGRSALDDNDEDEWISQSDGSSDDAPFMKSNVDVQHPRGKKSNKAKWESLNEASKDEELDAFIQKLSDDLNRSEKDAHDRRHHHHYTNLTDYMLRVDRTERHQSSWKPTTSPFCDDGKNKLNSDKFRLSLEQRLPLLEVLDTIGDINKILKDGTLTPRMERIMEYKQDHPFRYGYEEEQLGCCPWLVYKLENMFRRFLNSQWPYSFNK